MTASQPSLDPVGLDASLRQPFQAIDVLKLQTKFRSFYASVVNGHVDDAEIKRWCHYIQNHDIWNCIKNAVPGLMIREDEMSDVPDHPLTQLHLVLKSCGYLEPAMSMDPLGTVRQREFEAVQDYLYRIFPPFIHRELHGFVDAMYDTQTTFPSESTQSAYPIVVATGGGDVIDAGEHNPNAYNPHVAAHCDRIFNTLCAMWLIYRQDTDCSAYYNFRDTYKKHRAEQEDWNKNW